MSKKILCVDDDPNILSGFKRALRKDFEVFTAEGGTEGLELIKNESEFSVIISDMQMPVMNGVQFLERAKKVSPNSVRIMLTGNADQQTAVNAINNGNIFRFLTKPCDIDDMTTAIQAGIEQYRLVTAEKQLLNETLGSSLQVMAEILSMVNPTAFSRSNRVKRVVRSIAERIGLQNIWEVEIAAMLSQVGCITVDEEILLKIAKCEPLEANELNLYQQHPRVARELIARIPRMENVAEIIANQNRRFHDKKELETGKPLSEETNQGIDILKLVLDFDKLLDAGNLPHHAYKELCSRSGWYDLSTLSVLKELIDDFKEEFVSINVNIHELKPGMLLEKEVISNRRTMLLSAGQEVTLPLILRLINFAETGLIPMNIQVSVPVNALALSDIENGNRVGAVAIDKIC